ncbi:MAG: branched-chain amino acid ABC transporter substrate-binding protein [Castellaniella sp.]|uniref:branched-chain amino acid ABC transporter substrate-binding protein n=1 Tax=Castellaniella sp. TaxID=1955812 RepID=UPI001223C922|nr:branched-chain amino acid ABC transporter substrate-binding protein [Castellaniella sp.]TAN30810.1 MAG: branched-chain amino acid ABC transporter substrate-binding protein [Castellaniella sp.]
MANRAIFKPLMLCAALSVIGSLANAEPLKIAIVETLSGPQASTGLMYRDATRYAVERLNAQGGWGGEPIKLLQYDSQGTPAGAAEKLKAAIADGAQMVVQGASSAVAGQLSEDIRKYDIRNPGREVLFLNVGAEAMELTGSKCNFHAFRFAGNSDISVKALVEAMKSANTLGTKVYSINQNYSWGVDMQNAIGQNAAEGGYKVVGETLHDVNKIQDFSPYVQKIIASGAQTVITGNWSNDLLLLMKAAKAGGLKARFATTFLDQPGNLANAGHVALGAYVVHPFDAEANGGAGVSMADEFKAKVGHYPVYVEPQTLFGIEMVGAALKKVAPENGKLNINKLALQIEQTKLDTPMGAWTMRAADHQVLLPMVVSEVSTEAKFKVDGTDMGFKPVKLLTAAEAEAPVQGACKMRRPS